MWLIIDSIVILALALYLDQVLYRRQPVYFLVLPSFWTGKRTRDDREQLDDAEVHNSDPDVQAEIDAVRQSNGGKDFEGLAIDRIVKRFGDFTAVDRISYTAKVNQITALLGHNGYFFFVSFVYFFCLYFLFVFIFCLFVCLSVFVLFAFVCICESFHFTLYFGHCCSAGKSTLINMLVGRFTQTGGDAYFCGRDLTIGLDEVRRNIGVCPQRDLLFEQLSPMEHIELFGSLKRQTRAESREEAAQLLQYVDLLDVANKPAGQFSGGMKRRLSIAVSLVRFFYRFFVCLKYTVYSC